MVKAQGMESRGQVEKVRLGEKEKRKGIIKNQKTAKETMIYTVKENLNNGTRIFMKEDGKDVAEQNN